MEDEFIEKFVDTAISLRKPMGINIENLVVNVRPEGQALRWSSRKTKTFNFTTHIGPSEFADALYSIIWSTP